MFCEKPPVLCEQDVNHHRATDGWDHRSRPPRAALRRFRPSGYQRLKTWLDLVLSPLLLLLTGPLILLAAAAIKLTSRGPAFYKQTRLGRNGQPYTIYKIRTMRHDCEHGTGPRWATKKDPRTVWLGRFLRCTHLDELPQLLNVLRGEMSLIGPRPERPEFVAQLERAIPRYRDRLLVRPGLTGLSQVQLPADTDLSSVRRKVAHDVYYVQRLSLVLDLKILLSTVCYLMGIPFAVPRQLFRLPGGEAVERVFPDRIESAASLPNGQPSYAARGV
jgi:lipopolysaccharide/colanic/teichoic acid biosynthesis glycosyltransferase